MLRHHGPRHLASSAALHGSHHSFLFRTVSGTCLANGWWPYHWLSHRTLAFTAPAKKQPQHARVDLALVAAGSAHIGRTPRPTSHPHHVLGRARAYAIEQSTMSGGLIATS